MITIHFPKNLIIYVIVVAFYERFGSAVQIFVPCWNKVVSMAQGSLSFNFINNCEANSTFGSVIFIGSRPCFFFLLYSVFFTVAHYHRTRNVSPSASTSEFIVVVACFVLYFFQSNKLMDPLSLKNAANNRKRGNFGGNVDVNPRIGGSTVPKIVHLFPTSRPRSSLSRTGSCLITLTGPRLDTPLHVKS